MLIGVCNPVVGGWWWVGGSGQWAVVVPCFDVLDVVPDACRMPIVSCNPAVCPIHVSHGLWLGLWFTFFRYDLIDGSSGFYRTFVVDQKFRSRMQIVFTIRTGTEVGDVALVEEFLRECNDDLVRKPPPFSSFVIFLAHFSSIPPHTHRICSIPPHTHRGVCPPWCPC